MTRPLFLLAFFSPAIALAADVESDPGGPYSVDAESTVLLDGSGSTADSDCGSLSYRWDLNNNGSFDTPFSTTSSHSFSAAGYDGPVQETVLLEVQATCDGDLNDDDQSTTVTIHNVAPVISAIQASPSAEERASL